MATVKVSPNRRVARRYIISNADHARVIFAYPGPGGRRCELALIDISISGLSFRYRDELPDLESGATLSAVVIRLGRCEIHGDLLVMHLTPYSSGETVCGALFYPAKDADLLKLKSAIAGIEAVKAD